MTLFTLRFRNDVCALRQMETFGANSKKADENSCLKIKSVDDIISDEFDLAECFNDYFINIAANLNLFCQRATFEPLVQVR